MATSAGHYLERSVSGRHPDLPETTCGTVRLDIIEDGQTEHWYLTLDRQHVEVDRSAEHADLVVRADRAVFDRLATGEDHIGSALLRNDVTVQGDIRLLMSLRRIFPGRAGARHPRDLAGRPDGRS
ncbi:SCP2 sterol-binding domain-containing protein [Micromonospora sp. R77]|uniref:SCP2 sterol-binding domain-containing protein n=1 Tax=Micromonospora sp. R77 TaxID=2925836 RepID=UPI001F60F191|nr:SCP2 sterol-binding domain-containing protein [Micromonospora sp. R77]MCI4065170.1 SCP2 sterol-binding domain-containing protein [Micromonospora sp. R77]